MKVTGAELGKGKDIELWDSAGQNHTTTAIEMDFLISRGMTYVGYPRYISPRINEKVTGKIATEYTDTGIWLSGAPGPYTYEAKIAPIGMEIQTSTVFDKSYCYYQIIAKTQWTAERCTSPQRQRTDRLAISPSRLQTYRADTSIPGLKNREDRFRASRLHKMHRSRLPGRCPCF